MKLAGKNGNKSVKIDWLSDDAPPRIPIEVIDEPEYRIYVHFPQEPDLDKFAERIRQSRPHFRPYLGTANMVAYLRRNSLDFDIMTSGSGTGKLGGLLPKESTILNIQELRKKRVRITEVVAQNAVTSDFAFHHGEFIMDMGSVGIPGQLSADCPYVVDNGLTIPLI